MECPHYHKVLVHKASFEQHVTSIHFEERPYECSECHKCFAQAKIVGQHITAVHRGEKPYICEICGVAYGWPGNYDKHIKEHSEETK
jgi:KRAB domain-containing zinc finger protein